MAIEVKEQTTEQKQEERNQVERTAKDVADQIVKDLDLSTFPSEAQEETAEESQEPEEKQEPEAEVETNEPEQDPEPEEKNKRVQERIDELTREKKQLEARLKKLESQSGVKNSDPDMEKLEAMSVEELRNIKKNVLRAQRTADPAKLDELFELEEKVAKAIDTAPQRFQSLQIDRFNAVLEASAATVPNFDKVKDEIYAYAKNIYGRSASMQKSVDGQAEAWQLAVDHYSALQKLSVDKSKSKDLERKVNDLKKKTSLTTAVQRGASSSSDEAKLFNKAKSGSLDDKLNFFKKRVNVDALIDKEYVR